MAHDDAAGWEPTGDERVARHVAALEADPEFHAQVARVQAAVDSGDLSALGPPVDLAELRLRYRSEA